ncbi:helix-turn-helix type 11 domain-containing protein [[Clostridium] sordellii]|uniref:helix-turn-helix transcriptional regulator n=1 Tax=Paraclostridium sordellii TaxID=1505 RepID=UPI0005E0C3D2|nr:HTH domain-containing protein [Paeniclostridium sordellii]MBS6024206.1 HTH domain-containing protein [Paeniclostridium sordellii]MBX9180457.1 HTH domain-containing protein [Paeniclostridium sordellii]RGX07451.1 HTH domain-containing protein [Paeniclostridium sordellii]CEN82421.1 helix-turn-helix type 11 domain-containing protein [[Clostridium] sordellii] [Paeniclostridium sordellii]CEO07750.1 helix-turn-helix type 11 domain-containing protein [[Clostridium] sordellii] [Paeniclostridium sord
MRLLEILFYLLKINSKTTIKELAERFSVSEKTIQRDLDKLSLIGIPIISYRGFNGGIELDKNYIIAKYVLTENDYKDLILSLYISENIIEDLKKSDLINKFKLVDSNRCSEILEKLQDRLVIDLEEDKIRTDSYITKVINNCLDKKSFVRVEVKGNIKEIFPISYVLRREGLYLYFYDNNYKLILLDTICNAWECERYYNGPIIKYNDNKDKLLVES